MPVDWKAPDSFHRLIAATVASMDGQKLNYKRIADFYGEGATYDAIEGRFRIIKKQAAQLRQEVENGRPIAPARGDSAGVKDTTPRKSRTTKAHSSQDGVLNGRITKPHNSPAKRRNAQAKFESLESSTSASVSSCADEANTPASSTNNSTGAVIINDSFEYDQALNSFDIGYMNGAGSHSLCNTAPFNISDAHLDFSSFLDEAEVV